MGNTAENAARHYQITRAQQDEFAVHSQNKAEAAQKAGKFKDEIVPVTIKTRKGDIVVADDEESAERRFFDRWAAEQSGLRNDQPAVDRGGPPPTREVPGQAFSKPPRPDEIIGLFPEPGALR